LNIRANTSPSVVGSVRFQYDASFDRYENDPPYAMFGDVNGNYNAGNLTLGNHTLRGTASTGANGTGIVGPTRTVNFSVINSNARLSADAEASAEKAIKCFPNPSTDRFTVNLACKSSGSGTVAVYDEAGKLTKTLFEGSVSEGQ